jgi:hypothetical protein
MLKIGYLGSDLPNIFSHLQENDNDLIFGFRTPRIVSSQDLFRLSLRDQRNLILELAPIIHSCMDKALANRQQVSKLSLWLDWRVTIPT